MAKNKQPEKNNQNVSSDQQADNEAQIQEQLAHYTDIAQQLYASQSYQQAEEAIAPISDMTEDDQLTFLNALSRERNTDAASILLAINTLTEQKQVRKEARRALVRLESMNIYSQWTPPQMPSLIESLNTLSPSDINGIDTFIPTPDFGDDEDDEYADDEDFGDDEDDTFINEFIKEWGYQNYENAYDLLTIDSPLRGGLDKDAWVALRQQWAEQAKPEGVKVTVGFRYETEEEIENAPDTDESTQELDAFWSLVYQETPLDSSLPELPKASLSYPLTGRHWFWASYTLTQDDEDGEFLVHHLTDRVVEALQFSDDELNKRIDEIADELKTMPVFKLFAALEGTDEDTDESDNDEEFEDDELLDDEDEDEDDEDEDEDGTMEEQLEEAFWFSLQATHYVDALIAHHPEELTNYEKAFPKAAAIQDDERFAAYAALIAENIPAERNTALQIQATVWLKMFNAAIDEEEEELDPQLVERTEHVLRESLAINTEASDYMFLAQFLVSQDERLDEAEQLYQQALAVAGDSETRANIESGFADIAHSRQNPQEALVHLQRASELDPNQENVWYKLGDTYQELGQTHRAEESFIRSTEVDPENENGFAALASLWTEQGKTKEAIKLLEQGLDANPDSATLRGLMAIQYIDQHNYKKADQLLEEAEELDPDAEIIQLARQVLAAMQMQQQQQGKSKSNKRKK